MQKLAGQMTVFFCVAVSGICLENASLQAALEGSFSASKAPDGVYKIVKGVRGDPETGQPMEESAQVFCADTILSKPRNVFPEPIPEAIMELSDQLVRGKQLAEKEINSKYSGLKRPLSKEDQQVLRDALAKYGVYKILNDYIVENRKNPNSHLSICTRFWVSGPDSSSMLPGWKQLVDVCTSESPDFRDHIMFHDSPGFHPSIRRAGKLLSSIPEFRGCLEEVAEKIPVINKMISQVTMAAPDELVKKVKNEVWLAWEAAGVAQIVEAAGKDKPDQEKILQMIQACRAKAGVSPDPSKQ